MLGRAAVVISHQYYNTFVMKVLPKPGETLIADDIIITVGGKGTNQAYAAKLVGCDLKAIGRVGADSEGDMSFSQLSSMNIGTEYIIRDHEHKTGRGAIISEIKGNNVISVYKGASAYFSFDDFKNAEEWLKTCEVCGFQLEINEEAVYESIKYADHLGVKTFLDPAPVPQNGLPEWVYKHIDYIKPNEYEAFLLTGVKIDTVRDAVSAGRILLDKGVRLAAVITLGDKGVVLVTHELNKYFPAPKVNAVKTVGAGDSFAGAFVSVIANGGSAEAAVIAGSCLSGVKVTRMKSIFEESELFYNDYLNMLDDYKHSL